MFFRAGFCVLVFIVGESFGKGFSNREKFCFIFIMELGEVVSFMGFFLVYGGEVIE